jgi:hypothetical protein
MPNALARPPERIQLAKAATLVTEIFRRMFFTLWLGETMSLRTIGACPDAQIRQALHNKEAFPESFRKDPPPPASQGYIYCSPVSNTSAPGEFKTIAIRAPRVGDCQDYTRMWKHLMEERNLAGGLAPFAVRAEVYDKYRVPQDGRSLHNNLDRPPPDLRLISGQERANRYAIVDTSEVGDFCNYVLSFDETPSPATKR